MKKLLLLAAAFVVVLCYFALPSEGAGTCYYSVSHISSYRRYVRTYYWYYRYYYYRCGWWGWRRCRGSYRVYVYYTYSYVSYTINYHSQGYCCWGYSGSNCNPICYNSCGRCTTCLSPYNCQCQSGWSGSNCCNDYNECSNINGGCEQNCHNTVGSFYCSCNSGYSISSDGRHCKDINECNSNDGGCNTYGGGTPHHHCKNTLGSFYCSCDAGYSLSGSTCYDINECNNNNGGCDQNCINQPGSYHCTCNSGYTLDSDKHTCNDNNECTNGVANCNHFCLNTAGSYLCYCKSGYELAAQGDSDTCVDTQECLNNNGGCDQNCTNTIGSYFCTCVNGYNLTSNGHGCVDFDECANNAHLCEHHCYNNVGSYSCDCKIGYYLDANGLDCHDINECDTNNGGCEHNCTNTIGSYNCSCAIGWLLDPDDHGCSDHDECATNVHDCDENGVCHNTHGTYYCTCNIGFRLDDDGRTCNDINECAEHSSGCTQICNNTFGSYHCLCYDGFELTQDKHNCTDIDECKRDTDGCEKYCHNLIGSYYCSCQIGYQVGSDLHSCVGQPCSPQLSAPANGMMSCTGDQVTDQNCTFSCSPGYELLGSQQRNCLLTNSWTGQDASCRILECPVLEAPSNGYIWTQPCNNQFMDTCEIRCVDGFYINGTTPYYQTCVVNEANQVYWSQAPECEYIPPCLSSPCQNGGTCIEVSPVKFRCDCTGTHYTGLTCNIGSVSIPDLPIVEVNDGYSFTLSAKPDHEVILNIKASSPSIAISSSQIVFNSSHQSESFQVFSSVSGIYTLTYSLSGEDADKYETPRPSLIVINNPDSSHNENQYFTLHNKPVGQLSSGCCTPGGQIYQCPYSTNTVTFSSTCSWSVEEPGVHETQGVVYASGNGISMPFSIAGVELTLKGLNISYILPDDGGTCTQCNANNPSCTFYDITADDIIDMLETNSLARSYLSGADSIIPSWISFLIEDNINVTNRLFSVRDYTTSITTGANAYLVSGCSSLDLEPDGLYSILSYSDTVSVTVNSVSESYNSYTPVCFAVNLCEGTDSPIHVSIPSEAQNLILSFSQFQSYISNGWQFNFHESAFKQSGLNPPSGIPADYWIGSSTVTTTSVLPEFDVRLNVDTSTTFYNQPNVGVKFIHSGDIYHNSQPTGAEVQGMLTGEITLLVNMSLNQTTANMTLLTTSAPVLFTMPDYTSSGSVIRNGAAMKLNLFSKTNDVFFRDVLRLPAGSATCPVDTFVSLTSQNLINNIRLSTTCIGLSFIGYEFAPGTVNTTLYISGVSNPSPSYSSSSFSAYVNLLSDTGRLQLNDFVTVVQPTSAAAASIAYSATSVEGSIAEAEFSLFETHFSVPLSFTNAGFFFQTSVQMYNQFPADITGTLPIGKSWTNLNLTVKGQFSTANGGFIRSLEDYVYNYAQEQISESTSRLATAALAVNKSGEDFNNFTPYYALLNYTLQTQKQQYTYAINNYTAANATYYMAMEAASNLGQAAYDIYAELLNICPDMTCNKECLSMCSCKTSAIDSYIDACNIALVTKLEQMLQHKTVTSNEDRWTIDYICMVLVKIKGWAEIGFGHMCSHVYIYESYPHLTKQAYHTNVNVSRSEATVQATHQYPVTEPVCIEDSCGTQLYGINCMYQETGCSIARQIVINSLNSTEKAAIMPLLDLMDAKANLTIAANNLAAVTSLRNSAQRNVYDASVLQHKLKNQHLLAQHAYQSVQSDESNSLALKQYLEGITIQNLLSLNTVSFRTSIINTPPKVLPISINYALAGLGSYTVDADAQFTASLPVLKRQLARKILNNIGATVQQQLTKRSVILPTFNERQFEERCAMINCVKEYLRQVYESLGSAQASSSVAVTNISATVSGLNHIIAYEPTNYTNINYTILLNEYNTQLNSDQINTLAATEPKIIALKGIVTTLRDYTNNLKVNIPSVSSINWQLSMGSAHQAQRIGSVGGRLCYSFVDCLNSAVIIIKEVLQDTPGTESQALLQNLTMAKNQLLALAINTTFNLTTAAFEAPILVQIVDRILAMDYWCTGLPVISQPLDQSVHAEIGDTISITCDATSALPMTYTWKKDGFVVAGQSSKTFTKSNAGVSDEGQYQCLVSNAVGTVESTFSNVVIYTSPKITLHPTDYETYEGSDNGGYFACNATGHPIPSFRWYFRPDDQSPWTMVANDTNELVVRKPTKADQGWYRCTVMASIGHATSNSAYLSILRVNASKLIYSVIFNMNITTEIPPQQNSTNASQTMTPPPSTATIDYFRSELVLGKASIDHLQVGFSVDNNALLVRIDLSAYYEYQVDQSMEEQAPIALGYKNDLVNALNQLEHKVQNGIFWFELQGSYFQTVHKSASIANLDYWCPDGTVLRYSNFLCVTCPPGTYYVSENGTGVCNACPKNTYQENDWSYDCIDCPPLTETIGESSRWSQDCIDYCRPGYNSSTGLEPCSPCPPCYFNEEYKETTCIKCTNEHVLNDTQGCPSNCSVVVETTAIPFVYYTVPPIIAFVIIIALFVLVVVVVLFGIKYKRQAKMNNISEEPPRIIANQGRVSVALPNDMLSLIPESEQVKTEPVKYDIKTDEKTVEMENREVVNPLFLEVNPQENAYESLSKHQLNVVDDEKVIEKPPMTMSEDDDFSYTSVPHRDEQPDDLKGIGGIAARKAALFGR